MKNISGRPVDLSDINVQEIADWMKNSKNARCYIKCQSFISLYNGNSMQDVCKVLGITRETVRVWKNQLRKNGLTGLISMKKVGKRAKISNDKLQEIKKLIKRKPTIYGYEAKKWTGQILADYVEKKWALKIGIRAAQLWLRKIR
ncbi:MAG: helix-turn-helix domain-containing protein [Nanoarchaeota archaeon]|nr:helix-turn-helix domain-containing protein [Nanoarchaeota archaeon]